VPALGCVGPGLPHLPPGPAGAAGAPRRTQQRPDGPPPTAGPAVPVTRTWPRPRLGRRRPRSSRCGSSSSSPPPARPPPHRTSRPTCSGTATTPLGHRPSQGLHV